MAVILSASDENSGKDHRSMFFYGGLLAPVKDWWEVFTPRWEEGVLNGPPKIPYLHMTEIRSKAFRDEWGLSEEEAEKRIDKAFLVIDSISSLRPISSRMDAGTFFDNFNKKNKMVISSGARKTFLPDYLAFIGYVVTVLGHVADHFPDVEKVDFLVERKGGITDYINEFYKDIHVYLAEFREARLGELLGELIFGGKDRCPLQVADVFCWHAYKRETGTLTEEVDSQRYKSFTHRGGQRQHWEDGMLLKLREAIERNGK